jgi:hypothetical protein
MKPILVSFCVGCGQVCDEIEPEMGQPLWIDAHRYVTKYGFRWENLDRSDEVCPACARVFQAAVRHPSEAGVGGYTA